MMPFEKSKDLVNVFCWLMFISIVPASWQHCQFSGGEMAIKVHSLFHVEKKAPVREEHQGRTGYLQQ